MPCVRRLVPFLAPLLLLACRPYADTAVQVTPVAPALVTPKAPKAPAIAEILKDGVDERLWGPDGDKKALIGSIDASLRYLSTPRSKAAYARRSPRTGITHNRVQRSLLRFRALLKASPSKEVFEAKVRKEFVTWKPKGTGRFLFTGYFEPVYQASLRRTSTYRFPLYRRPTGVPGWQRYTSVQIEGKNGLGGPSGPFRGYELVWLRNRLEAYLAQVQGSLRVRLTDGRILPLAFDGHTAQSYKSLGMELVRDGKIPLEELTLPVVVEYLRTHPGEEN